MSDLRTFTLSARDLLTQEAGDLLQQVYRLDVKTAARLPIPRGHLLESSAEAQTIRKRIEKLIEDEVDTGLKREAAVTKLIKETAFTHLNRLVAFKLMEARGLIRSPLARRHEANGFKMWLAAQPEEEAHYNRGDSPNDRDGFGEAPRDRAYRHFLLWQCGELAREIQVLFDPYNMPSLLFPRPGVLKELVDALNAEERKDDWATGNEETLGWVYQYFNAEEKAAAFDKVFKGKKKFERHDLPAATQIFTPRWVVRFLVENSLGRLWLSMHPDSNLGERWAYLTPPPASPPASALKPVREIRVLDPATGTMHFGLVAFDLLAEMYREELDNAGKPGWPTESSVATELEVPAAILANNLYGIDIDLRAVQLAALALYLKAKGANKQATLTESNLACADVAIFRGQHLTTISNEMALPRGITRELFVKFRDSLEEAAMMGSLVRLDRHFQNFESGPLRQSIDAYVEKKRAEGIDESYFANETGKGIRLLNILERRYDVVCTNPPYMSIRNMDSSMCDFMKANYKRSKGDLYSAFIERCAELLATEGRLAMIAQQSFMFTSTFTALRELLLGATALESMAHLGPRAFAEVTGEKVNTTAFTLRREQLEMERRESRGVYFRLVKEPDANSKQTAFEQCLARRRAGEPDSRVSECRQGDFPAIPGSPWVYWISSSLRGLFRSLPKLEDIAQPRQGLATADNFRFLRYWWEVGQSRIAFDCKDRKESEGRVERWYPHLKGGGFQRWYGNQEYTINYGRNGYELKAWADPLYGNSGWSRIIKSTDCYFQRGVTWSRNAGNKTTFRIVEGGFVIDVNGSFIPDATRSPFKLLGILNSPFCLFIKRLLNPTISFQAGDVCKVPVPLAGSDIIEAAVKAVIESEKCVSAENETTYDFIVPPAWPTGTEHVAFRRRDSLSREREIYEEVYRLYAISPEDRRAIEDELAIAPEVSEISDEAEAEGDEEAAEVEVADSLTPEKLAQLWVSYAVGIALCRFAPGELGGLGRGILRAEMNNELRSMISDEGMLTLQRDHPNDLANLVINILTCMQGDAEAGRIVRLAIGGTGDLRDALAGYLLGPFFKAHIQRYRKRPVYWLLQSPKQKFSVYLFHERATDQTLAQLQGNSYLGGRIFQLKQRELSASLHDTAQA